MTNNFSIEALKEISKSYPQEEVKNIYIQLKTDGRLNAARFLRTNFIQHMINSYLITITRSRPLIYFIIEELVDIENKINPLEVRSDEETGFEGDLFSKATPFLIYLLNSKGYFNYEAELIPEELIELANSTPFFDGSEVDAEVINHTENRVVEFTAIEKAIKSTILKLILGQPIDFEGLYSLAAQELPLFEDLEINLVQMMEEGDDSLYANRVISEFERIRVEDNPSNVTKLELINSLLILYINSINVGDLADAHGFLYRAEILSKQEYSLFYLIKLLEIELRFR